MNAPANTNFRVHFDVLTLFPELFDSFLSESILARAIKQEFVSVQCWNIRDFSENKHNRVDDKPYGGGPGMVLCPQPVFDCYEHVVKEHNETLGQGEFLLLSPRGETFKQSIAQELSTKKRIVLLCGRYEGFDQRIIEGLKPREISIGDYVCNGGEIPAMLLIESIMRLIPGVLGDDASVIEESFADENWLEYPQYTRPAEFRGMKVPDVLQSGDHAKIEKWRKQNMKRK